MARTMSLTEETFLVLHYARKPLRSSEVAVKLYGENTVQARLRAASCLHSLKEAGLIEKRGKCTWKNIKGRRYPVASNLAASTYKK